LLYLGRLDEKKGIDKLLRALAILPPQEFSLTVCGSGNSHYVSGLVELCDALDLRERVKFAGQAGPTEKSKAFFDSDVCIIPSHTENFGMVIAESLAHGTPVIASTGTPWGEIEEVGCGFWVNNDPLSLAEAIRRMREADLESMGLRGRKWMMETYSWNDVVRKMLNVYEDSYQISKGADETARRPR
jgi:glycosyltransferase involved in cell wall biosynthesis